MTKIRATGFWDEQNPVHTVSHTLSNWIINYLQEEKEKPIYDFGTGKGQYLKLLKEAGFTNLTGYEGRVPDVKEFDNILQQDLTHPFTVPVKGTVVFLEVAEHIPARYENAMLTNVANACETHLISSWAVRGQGGDGHFNELNNEEAIERITRKGFTYLPEETASAREVIIYDHTKDCCWFKNTLLIFKRK